MKNKIIKTITALCLAVLVTVGLMACGESRRVEQDNNATPNDVIAVSDDGTEFFEGKTYPLPQSLVLLSAPANNSEISSFNLSASLEPHYLYSNKEVDWNISWVNPDSAWATNKNVIDFVSITPTTNGASVARFSYKQPFGEQIKVRVSARKNTDVSAESIVDCLRQVIEVEPNFWFSNGQIIREEINLFYPPVGITPYINLEIREFLTSFAVRPTTNSTTHPSNQPYTLVVWPHHIVVESVTFAFCSDFITVMQSKLISQGVSNILKHGGSFTVPTSTENAGINFNTINGRLREEAFGYDAYQDFMYDAVEGFGANFVEFVNSLFGAGKQISYEMKLNYKVHGVVADSSLWNINVSFV
ncbi:MAG: hypothetical protein FWD49_07605 [Firmicutes bacterium]|nr:hypothetical protein [Bacillota bacterium]